MKIDRRRRSLGYPLCEAFSDPGSSFEIRAATADRDLSTATDCDLPATLPDDHLHDAFVSRIFRISRVSRHRPSRLYTGRDWRRHHGQSR